MNNLPWKRVPRDGRRAREINSVIAFDGREKKKKRNCIFLVLCNLFYDFGVLLRRRRLGNVLVFRSMIMMGFAAIRIAFFCGFLRPELWLFSGTHSSDGRECAAQRGNVSRGEAPLTRLH